MSRLGRITETHYQTGITPVYSEKKIIHTLQALSRYMPQEKPFRTPIVILLLMKEERKSSTVDRGF